MDKKIMQIKGLLEAERNRVNSMLALVDKADKDIDIIRVFEQGFELAKENASMAQKLCKEMMS